VGRATRGGLIAEPDRRLGIVDNGGALAGRIATDPFGPLDRRGDLLPRPVFGVGDTVQRPGDLVLRLLGA
jgi:hypothetical protein